MIRFAALAFLIAFFLWAPWMDAKNAEELSDLILAAFGPMPSACYDSAENKLQDGVTVRWYPMGRMVHTCTGDYLVWFWGDVKEFGGISKKAEEIQALHSKALACDEVLERQEARRATSTDSELSFYTGPAATSVDYSIFPEAEEYNLVINTALKKGPNFAGRFAVAEWGCGGTCQNHAIIDVESGLVITFGPRTEYGVDYALESTLLITNPLNNLPQLPDDPYETETMALSLARVPREYYRLTYDALSDTRYLVLQCLESSAVGYIEIEDDRIGVIVEERSS